MTAYQALFDVFKRSFNYNYNEDVPKREQATRLWEKWWLENQAKISEQHHKIKTAQAETKKGIFERCPFFFCARFTAASENQEGRFYPDDWSSHLAGRVESSECFCRARHNSARFLSESVTERSCTGFADGV